MAKFTAVSLFSGAVDGLGIAASVAGFNVTHHVEWDAWCCRVLRKNFPNSIVIEEDIHNVHTLPTADVVLGSPPCQGWSNAGNGRGEDDPRNLWPDMLRLVQQSRPRCVLVENVRGGIARGYIDLVCGGLEAAGYEAQALVYPAAVVGAPHIRDRVFILAHTNRFRRPESPTEQVDYQNRQWDLSPSDRDRRTEFYAPISSGETMGNASSVGEPHQQESEGTLPIVGQSMRPVGHSKHQDHQLRMVGSHDGTAPRLDSLTGDFPGFPNYLGLPQHAHEPARLVVEEVPYHKERIAAVGNAVVWQQAYPLMRGIRRWLEANHG